MVKNPPANAEDTGSIPGSERYPGGGNGNPLQYSRWDNPINGEAWWTIVHGVAKNQTGLSTPTHSLIYFPERLCSSNCA